MSVLVPFLVVLGLVLMTCGAFRMIGDTRRDKIVGGILLTASVTSLSAGALGFLETIR